MGMIPLKEWAEKKGIKPASARQKAARGTIPATKIGRDWIIEEEEPNRDGRRKEIILSDIAASLALAVSKMGIDAIKLPKYARHIKKTYVIKFNGEGEKNGKVIYVDTQGLEACDYHITFDCDVFNPPMLGEVIEMEMSVKEMHEWEQENLLNKVIYK